MQQARSASAHALWERDRAGKTHPQLAASTMAMQNASVSDVFKKIWPFTRTCTLCACMCLCDLGLGGVYLGRGRRRRTLRTSECFTAPISSTRSWSWCFSRICSKSIRLGPSPPAAHTQTDERSVSRTTLVGRECAVQRTDEKVDVLEALAHLGDDADEQVDALAVHQATQDDDRDWETNASAMNASASPDPLSTPVHARINKAARDRPRRLSRADGLGVNCVVSTALGMTETLSGLSAARRTRFSLLMERAGAWVGARRVRGVAGPCLPEPVRVCAPGGLTSYATRK